MKKKKRNWLNERTDEAFRYFLEHPLLGLAFYLLNLVFVHWPFLDSLSFEEPFFGFGWMLKVVFIMAVPAGLWIAVFKGRVESFVKDYSRNFSVMHLRKPRGFGELQLHYFFVSLFTAALVYSIIVDCVLIGLELLGFIGLHIL